MNKFTRTGLAIAASLVMAGMASTAQAKDCLLYTSPSPRDS